MIRWKQVLRVTGAEAIREFWKGEAEAKESEFELSIIERRQHVEKLCNLPDPVVNNSSGKRDIADRGA